MTQPLSPGRWRGLKTTSTDGNIFTIMAFDQRGTFRKMLPPGSSYEAAISIKSEVVASLSRYTSAVLLDAQYGLSAMLHMSRSSGLLLALEESGYTGDSTYRRIEFNPDWTVSKVRAAGASAVKLLAYYHPGSGALAEEIEGVVASVIEECHRQDIPLFLEPVSYSLDKEVSKDSAAFAETRSAVVVETARRLGALKPDVLKMEFPIDAAFNSDERAWQAACEGISAVSDVPWVLLSAGVDFETFERQTRVACKSGASGFLAGRAIWKECVAMSPEERTAFLSTTGADRILKLADIAGRTARPWTAFYEAPIVSEDWYRAYQAVT